MTDQELIEIFFYRSFEEDVNDKMLDDYSYVLPMDRIREYVNKLLAIPYSDFLYFIISWDFPPIGTDNHTQCSCFTAAEIEMCHVIIENGNPGYDFIEIGNLFPQYCTTKTVQALRKYGENQIKTAKQLGLAFCYYNSWYLNCLAYVYAELDEKGRRAFLARTLLRDALYGTMMKDLISSDIILNNYMKELSPSTVRRRKGCIIKILKIAIRAAREEGIELHDVVCLS